MQIDYEICARNSFFVAVGDSEGKTLLVGWKLERRLHENLEMKINIHAHTCTGCHTSSFSTYTSVHPLVLLLSLFLGVHLSHLSDPEVFLDHDLADNKLSLGFSLGLSKLLDTLSASDFHLLLGTAVVRHKFCLDFGFVALVLDRLGNLVLGNLLKSLFSLLGRFDKLFLTLYVWEAFEET